ncbi:MAG: sigma-70 family RNA polymerase sigma factor [Microthrixaceae bacterium]
MDDADNSAGNDADRDSARPLDWPTEPTELVDRIRTAMSTLPPSHRKVVELTYLQGVSSQEVAAQLDLPLDHVTQLRHEALEHIRGELYPPSIE